MIGKAIGLGRLVASLGKAIGLGRLVASPRLYQR
jgi:hypothetical protein